MQIGIKQFESDKQLTRTLFNNFGKVIVFIFYAEWNQPSKQFYLKFKQTMQVFGQYDNTIHFAISAQKCPQTLKKFNVEFTPTVIFTQTDKKILKKIQSTQNKPIDLSNLFEQLQQVSEAQIQQFQKDRLVWHPKIDSILNSCPVMVFIKGTPANPKCGFTSQILEILKNHSIQYTYYDIIEDQYMRYWLRQYHNWPTYPQLFINGKVIGGLDLIKQLVAKGQFIKMVPQSCRKVEGSQKYSQIIKQHQIIAFIDGFTFNSQPSKQFVNKAIQKYGEDKIYLFNTAIDPSFKQYLNNNVKKVPFVVLSGKICQ